MKLEDELMQLEKDFNKIQNPYKEAAEKANNLKINDFSVQDKKLAEKILIEKKLKAELKLSMEKNHTHIDCFCERAGINSIGEIKNLDKSPIIGVNVSRVANKDVDDENADNQPLVAVLKNINLNKNLLEEELNQIYIDDQLAEQLLLQEPDMEVALAHQCLTQQDSARTVHINNTSVFDKRPGKGSKTVT